MVLCSRFVRTGSDTRNSRKFLILEGRTILIKNRKKHYLESLVRRRWFLSPPGSKVPINITESGTISTNADTALKVRDSAFASRNYPIRTNEVNSELLSNNAINLGRPLLTFIALYSTAEIK